MCVSRTFGAKPLGLGLRSWFLSFGPAAPSRGERYRITTEIIQLPNAQGWDLCPKTNFKMQVRGRVDMAAALDSVHQSGLGEPEAKARPFPSSGL